MTDKKNDPETLQKWTTPVGAFVTFYTEHGVHCAINPEYNPVEDFYGCEMETLKRAKEPSDIIWENRSIPKKQVRRNGLILSLLIFIISLGIFYLTIMMLRA